MKVLGECCDARTLAARTRFGVLSCMSGGPQMLVLHIAWGLFLGLGARAGRDWHSYLA